MFKSDRLNRAAGLAVIFVHGDVRSDLVSEVADLLSPRIAQILVFPKCWTLLLWCVSLCVVVACVVAPPRPLHRYGHGCTVGVLLEHTRVTPQDETRPGRQLVRLVLCRVDVLSGHGNNVGEVAEYALSSNTPPQSKHRGVATTPILAFVALVPSSRS